MVRYCKRSKVCRAMLATAGVLVACQQLPSDVAGATNGTKQWYCMKDRACMTDTNNRSGHEFMINSKDDDWVAVNSIKSCAEFMQIKGFETVEYQLGNMCRGYRGDCNGLGERDLPSYQLCKFGQREFFGAASTDVVPLSHLVKNDPMSKTSDIDPFWLMAENPDAKEEDLIKAAKRLVEKLGLQAGGKGYDFAGPYYTKGLYAYSSGYYEGRAYFGTGGNVEQRTAPSDHPTYKAVQYRPDYLRRCGPKFGDQKCNAKSGIYCDEGVGLCGESYEHKISSSGTYDFQEYDGRCGPDFGNRKCYGYLGHGMYCNESNGYCTTDGNTVQLRGSELGFTWKYNDPELVQPAVKLSCAAGTYQADGAAACTKCEAGKFSEANATECRWCPYGERPNADQSGCVFDFNPSDIVAKSLEQDQTFRVEKVGEKTNASQDKTEKAADDTLYFDVAIAVIALLLILVAALAHCLFLEIRSNKSSKINAVPAKKSTNTCADKEAAADNRNGTRDDGQCMKSDIELGEVSTGTPSAKE